MSESFQRFNTYEFEGDPSLMTPHLAAGPSIRVNNGTTSYSTYVPKPEVMQASPHQSIRVGSGSISYTAGDADVKQNGGHCSYMVNHDGTAGGSVASTFARSGALQTVELIPGQPLTRTDVRSAEREGLIERDGRGGWRDVANQAPAMAAMQALTVNPEDLRQAAPPVGESFDKGELADWNHDIGPIDQVIYDSSVARSIEAVASGKGLDSVAMHLAKSAGMDPARAAEYVSEGTAMYQRAVDRDLARVGIVGQDLAAFYEHLRKEQPGQLRHALQKVALQHDISEFKKLGVSWQQTRMRRGR